MTNRQIDASRETRLWITQVILPIAGVAMMIPETRQAVMEKIKNTKKNIENKFKKR